MRVETQSSRSMVPFFFNGKQVRTIMRDGDPWFVGKDVAVVLGYANPRDALRRHCKATSTVAFHDGSQDRHIKIIPERDVYRLIFRSKLPAAEAFEDWVVGTVLPSIRKTGCYVAPGYTSSQQPETLPLESPACAARLSARLRERAMHLAVQTARLTNGNEAEINRLYAKHCHLFAGPDPTPETDPIMAFIAECCEVGPSYSASSQALYQAYREWISSYGKPAWNHIKFGRRMAGAGYASHKRSTKFYQGLRPTR